MGWTREGSVYHEIPKKIFVVIPHTSNWDYPIGMIAKWAFGLKLNYLGKASLFKPPLGWIIKPLGGVAVDRSKKNKMVDQIIAIFNSKNTFALALTPEGTRKAVTSLKKGFYYTALGAKVPLIFVSFDYKQKTIRFREPFYPSGDYNADMKLIMPFYQGVVGKREQGNSIPLLQF